MNTALQLAALMLVGACFLWSMLHRARVALCGLLVLCSVLSIENAHTIYHMKRYAPPLTLVRGKVSGARLHNEVCTPFFVG